jgi:hypothetical protein
MFRLDLATITLAEGVAVRIRPVGPGGDVATVVERWNGSAWVTGADVVAWANGRPATAAELAALVIPTSDWPPNLPSSAKGNGGT